MFVKGKEKGRNACSMVGGRERRKKGGRMGVIGGAGGGGREGRGGLEAQSGAALEVSQAGSSLGSGSPCGEGSSGRHPFPGTLQLQTPLLEGTLGQTRVGSRQTLHRLLNSVRSRPREGPVIELLGTVRK